MSASKRYNFLSVGDVDMIIMAWCDDGSNLIGYQINAMQEKFLVASHTCVIENVPISHLANLGNVEVVSAKDINRNFAEKYDELRQAAYDFGVLYVRERYSQRALVSMCFSVAERLAKTIRLVHGKAWPDGPAKE